MERPSPSTTYLENSLDAFSRSDNKHMITSIHTLIYSDDAKATRAFLRDVLGWKYVTEDLDDDWLIFKSGPSEMGVHPTHSVWEGKLMITRGSTRSRSCATISMRRSTSYVRKERSSGVQSSNASTAVSS